MLLSYHGRAAVVADLDAELGALRLLPRPSSVGFGDTVGWFCVLDGVCVVLYVGDDDRFRLRIGDREVVVDDSVRVGWTRQQRRCALVVDSAHMHLEVSYPPPPPRSPDDLTPFVEESDDDFGLFVSEVLGDPERMARVAARVRSVRDGAR
ncbi:hypothetical protein [Cellulomonas xiejunii]|uniref:Uncharacterized protein n=2 Tax=Cellulomonas xiejunii TaxID=2968083 RepID=A0ABY5KS26_9CELL|nr:hypothetical protein [Cellulomonas xiejunii]UUI73049.1 hypothetical protein NP048_06305 [Cellulomonas xiejunii]